MDLRDSPHLRNVTNADAIASPVRPLLIAALSVVVIGALGWFAFGRSTDSTPASAPPVQAQAAKPAASETPAREAAGTIPGESKPGASAAAAPAAVPAPVPAPASPAPVAVASSTPSTPTAPAVASAAVPASQPAAASAGNTPAATELKMDTEFASARRIVPFAFNKVGVGPRGLLAVKELAPLAKQAEKVYVRGRTDGLGGADANRKVALDRAYTVFYAFLREGVQKNKLRLTYCSTCFAAANDTEEGRRLNRRVEVELLMPPDAIAKLPKPVHAPEAPPPLIAPLASSEILQSIPR